MTSESPEQLLEAANPGGQERRTVKCWVLVLTSCAAAAVVFWVAFEIMNQPWYHRYRRSHKPAAEHRAYANDTCTLGSEESTIDAYEPVVGIYRHYTVYSDDAIHDYPIEEVRTLFGGNCVRIHGWPSTGGIWVKEESDSVELDFLGVPLFESSDTERHTDPVAEDAFCKRLEMIGGQFLESDAALRKQESSLYTLRFQLWYGWPGAVPDGGLWALRTTYLESAQLGTSRIRNARTMAERCKAIEALGGKFYERWEDVRTLHQSNTSKEHAEL